MLISPVETRGVVAKGTLPGGDRGDDIDAFARLLQASVAKGKSDGNRGEKAAAAAEIMRLELMRSALTISDTSAEPAPPPIGNALKNLLSNFIDTSQKTDTNPPEKALRNDSANPLPPVSTTPVEKISSSIKQTPISFDPIISSASRRYGVDEGLIRAVIKAESDFNPRAVSRAGARGLMQLMPGTAAGLGVRDSFDPEQNIMAGTRFLRDMLERYNGDVDSALAAYNWGPGNVDRNRGAFMPKETREYLVKVKRYYADYVG